MKHTETPWYYDEEEGEIRCEQRDYLIANIEPQDISEPEDLFNGEYIVKCANAHEKLVDALFEALPFIEDAEYNQTYKIDSVRGVKRRIQEALQAAGEKV